MKVYLQGADRSVTCSDRNFVAQGGEGAVYVDGDDAIKIYSRPELMIPTGKISELAAIATPDILAPLGVVLRNDQPVGYWMKFAADCLPLPKIYPRSWRAKNGLDPDVAMRLVIALRNNYSHVHGERCLVNIKAPTWRTGSSLVVDGNDMNFLVRSDLSGLVHIDVDSYKTPSYDPTAIMESVRDPTTKYFTVETDWYSFAIVTFSLMVGIHPFKGTHPDYKPGEILKRMSAGASALLPGVRLPKPCMPLDVIPAAWRTWLEGVFHHGDRSAPPKSTAPTIVTAPAIAATPGDIVRLEKILDTPAPAVHLVRTSQGLLAALTDGRFILDKHDLGRYGWTSAPIALGLTLRARVPMAFWEVKGAGGSFDGVDLLAGGLLSPVRADAMVSSEDGLVHMKRGEDLLEMRYLESKPVRLAPERIGSVTPVATQLFPGVAIQSLLGSTFASLLPKPGRCVQVRLKEIEGARLIDARFVGGRGKDGRTGVLKVAVERRGQIDLHTWSGLWPAGRFELHDVEEDVGAADINMAELDTGTCVSISDDGSAHLFRPGRPGGQVVKDAALANARLFADAGHLLAIFDDGVYRVRMSP